MLVEILTDYVITYKGGFRSQRGSSDIRVCLTYLGFPDGSVAKNPPAGQGRQETRVRPLGQDGLLEEEMATHSSILA